MNMHATVIGGLSCQVIDAITEHQNPRLIVVLCHGFGAPGTDLVPVGPELIQLNPTLAQTVRFVFPAAPLSLDHLGMFGGRAWWHVDVARLTAAIERGELRDLRNDLPDELPQARQMLTSLVEELSRDSGLPTSRIVLGGFSQGAMLGTDVALRLPETPAALCIWSGTLLCEAEWRELAKQRENLRVLQSHGRQDPLLPFQAAIWLRDMFTESGAEVDFVAFDGMHTIPPEALHRFAALIGQLANE